MFSSQFCALLLRTSADRIAYPKASARSFFQSPNGDFRFDLSLSGEVLDVAVSLQGDASGLRVSDPIHYQFGAFAAASTLDYRKAPIPVKSGAATCDRADRLPAHI
ncbi:MAG: hypothetical protein H7301_08090 [Cryobacterium sp.]|nr:hypothetical protein [Oligoflexia bacterium]